MPKSSKRGSARGSPSPTSAGGRQASADGQVQGGRSFIEYVRRALPVFGPVGIVAIAAVVLVIAADSLLSPKDTAAYGGKFVDDQGVEHILPGQLHPAYNSTPPTSGWHVQQPAPWGVQDKPIPDEIQIHNLEHGGIVVQYSCSDGCPQLVEQLKGVVGRYRSKVVLAPYAKPLPKRIALTAWTWIDTFDDFDERRITAFIDAHKNRGPEQMPD